MFKVINLIKKFKMGICVGCFLKF